MYQDNGHSPASNISHGDFSQDNVDDQSQSQSYDQQTGSRPSTQGKSRARLPTEIVKVFEQIFQKTKNPPSDTIQSLAQTYGLSNMKVKTWFNNRKAKEKRLQLEAAAPQSSKAVTPVLFDHTLTTATGVEFNIDETPSEFTVDMFLAMRERIELLECQIRSSKQSSKRSGSSLEDPSLTRSKRTKVGSNTVLDYMRLIQSKLHSEVSQLKFERPDEVQFVEFDISIVVQEFVAVFDEKGGAVSQNPKDPHDQGSENLVCVDFSSRETVSNLLGPDYLDTLEATYATGDGDSTKLSIHSLFVSYDRSENIARLKFTVLPRDYQTPSSTLDQNVPAN